MQRWLGAVLLGVGLCSWTGLANDESLSSSEIEVTEDGPLTLRTNVAYLLNGNWNINFDVALADRISFGPAFLYLTGRHTHQEWRDNVLTRDESTKMGAFAFGIQTSFHLTSPQRDRGLILSPFVYLAPGSVSHKESAGTYDAQFMSVMAGSLLSYGISLEDLLSGASLKLGAGAAYLGPRTALVSRVDKRSERKEVTVPSFFSSGWIPLLDVSLSVMI